MSVNDNKYLSGIICKQLESGSPVVIVSIIGMEGSTPRESGTKMVVASDGHTYGTVGGSLLEATAITNAGEVLDKGRSRFMRFNLYGKGPDSKSMICGGKTELLLDFISPTAENRQLFIQMSKFISEGVSFYFVTGFVGVGSSADITGHCLVFPDGTVMGDDILTEADLTMIRGEMKLISSTSVVSTDTKSFIIDLMRKSKRLYCFGAGHVAMPTAHIAAMVGFQVAVVDDRDEFARAERFPDADNIYVRDFDNALEGLDIDTDSFIIILTRGHKFDRVVLEQAIRTDAGYIGMIGSRTKRDVIYKALIAEGIASAEDLEKVHSPIGLPISGKTPGEIAVSIVAELIQERERQTK
jgi:xanthine dehydrogenase accessory factor